MLVVDRQRRVTVNPVQPRVVVLDRATVARIGNAREVITKQQPVSAKVAPVNPRVMVSNVGRPGRDGARYVAQPEAPADTSVLWIDTDDTSGDGGGDSLYAARVTNTLEGF